MHALASIAALRNRKAQAIFSVDLPLPSSSRSTAEMTILKEPHIE